MFNEGKKAFDTSAAVAAKRLVEVDSSGEVAQNDGTATNPVVGVSEYAAASGDVVGVQLLNRGGTVEIIASEAVAIAEVVYAAADGKISGLSAVAGDYRRIGIALEAATADGDAIEVLVEPAAIVDTVAA